MALETITAEELVNTPLRSPGWVVEDLIGVGVTLLVGAPKVGKSWLVLRLAECVSRGEPLWGFATCGGHRPRPRAGGQPPQNPAAAVQAGRRVQRDVSPLRQRPVARGRAP